MPIPGSPFRRVLFWLHLSSGVAAGLVIFVLSLTGVLLAYEKQLIAHAAHANRVEAPAGTALLDADALARAVRGARPDVARFSLVFDADPAVPVTASQGREFSLLLNPYTAEVIADATAGTRELMRVVERWHRTLAGTGQSTRASIVDIANLLFLFMVLSGLYLWLPAVWRWRTVRGVLLFRGRYVNAKVRDFSWHHVFGVWALLPLFLITLSGVVMSYPWANRLVFAAYGEQPPLRRAPEGGGERAAQGRRPAQGADGNATPQRASLEALLAAAKSRVSGWQRLTIPAQAQGRSVEVTAELISAAPRAPRQTITLNAADAGFVGVSQPPATSPAQRARTWLRFVHTGEQFGIVGQTIAALASLAACFLVYTGLALAWRRLIVPLWRRRKAPAP